MHVDITDIGCSDHFLVWRELGRTTKKGKHVIRRWCLDRLADDEVKLRYQNGLRAKCMDSQRAVRGKLRGA